MFKKKDPISNFTEIRPLGATLMRENKMTDMEKVIDTFRDYANAPKNDIRSTSQVIKCCEKQMQHDDRCLGLQKL